MSVAISYRVLATFVAGVAATVIAVFAFQAVTATAAPGDADATFVAMTPCRLMDTRANPAFHVGPQSTFGAGETKTIQARGSNGNCVLPADAVGVSSNVTAVGASAPTFLTIWPDGARPVASSLNPVPGQPPTPNAVATNLSGSGSFEMFNLAGTVDVIVDVNGYYTNTSLQELAAGLAAANSRIDALEAPQPFAEVATNSTVVNLTPTPMTYLDLEVTAPVDGHLTVNYSTVIGSVITGGETSAKSMCNVFESTEIPATFLSDLTPGVSVWETANSDADDGSLSGTNRFDISAGQTVTYSLACEETFGTSFLLGRAMTATFTPTP